jgi:hypothetical protein
LSSVNVEKQNKITVSEQFQNPIGKSSITLTHMHAWSLGVSISISREKSYICVEKHDNWADCLPVLFLYLRGFLPVTFLQFRGPRVLFEIYLVISLILYAFYRNVDIKFSAIDNFLKYTSKGTLKILRLEDQII